MTEKKKITVMHENNPNWQENAVKDFLKTSGNKLELKTHFGIQHTHLYLNWGF